MTKVTFSTCSMTRSQKNINIPYSIFWCYQYEGNHLEFSFSWPSFRNLNNGKFNQLPRENSSKNYENKYMIYYFKKEILYLTNLNSTSSYYSCHLLYSVLNEPIDAEHVFIYLFNSGEELFWTVLETSGQSNICRMCIPETLIVKCSVANIF